MKRVKLTVLGATGTEYSLVVEVEDDYDLPPITNQDDWIEIEGADGTVVMFPPQRVIGIVMEGRKPPTKAAKGGRIN